MKVLIDGDGCPVIDIVISVAKKLKVEVVILCDTSHLIYRENVETIIISKGENSVDFALINKMNKKDVVVTQDYGLATMVLAKGGYCINQNGLIYDDSNINELLYSRHISQKLRKSGGKVKGPKKRTDEDNLKFEKSLRKLFNNINQ